MNPDGYNANVAAWNKALGDAARAGVIPAQGNSHHLLNIQAGDELLRALQHPQYGRPTCLPAVFHDAVSKKEMMPLHDYLTAPTSIYKTSWVPTPWGVLQWGLRQIGVLGQPGFGDKLAVGNFVVLKNIEVAAGEILNQMGSHASAVDRILTRSEFLKRYDKVLNPGAALSSNDLNIILLYLAREKGEISYNAQTIKFKTSSEPRPLPITQEDTAIAQLRDTIAKVNAQIGPLTDKVTSADRAAREAVTAKQMVRAKAALRSKKLAESALAQRTDVALQLEGVYSSLQQAADQVEIVEAMRQSAVALKGLNQKVGGAEGVSGVVDALREEIATVDEISGIINEAGESVDETEIDDELEALEKAEKEKKEAEEAAKTATRLAELEQLEKQRKEKEREREALEKKRREAQDATTTKEPQASKEETEVSQRFGRLSFVEEPVQETEDRVMEAA